MASPERNASGNPSRAKTATISFTGEDLARFSAASHDHNPLHVSEEYARATPYGEPVVFGILGVLAALGQLPDRPHHRLQSLSVEFRNPLTVGVSYRLEVSTPSIDCEIVKLYDTTRLMLKATFAFAPAQVPAQLLRIHEGSSVSEAADRTKTDLTPGTRVTGEYGPGPKEFVQVVTRW